MTDNRPRVIVVGELNLAQYLSDRTPEWFVYPPAPTFDDLWNRIDEFQGEAPNRGTGIDPSSPIVVFQGTELRGEPGEMERNIIAFGKVPGTEVFLFAKPDVASAMVAKIRSLESDEGIRPGDGTKVRILPADSEEVTQNTLRAYTAHLVSWGDPATLRTSPPPTPGAEPQHAPGSHTAPAGTIPNNADVTPPSPAPPPSHTATVPYPEPVIDEYNTNSMYSEETLALGVEEYVKPDNARPGQMTIAVMSSKGGTGKCVRGDQWIVDSVTGRVFTMEEFHTRHDTTNASPSPTRELSADVHTDDAATIAAFNGTAMGSHTVSQSLYSGVKKTFTVTLASGTQLSLTDNHPLLTADGWKELHTLLEGDTIAVPSYLPSPGNAVTVPREVAELAGMHFGDLTSAHNQVERVALTEVMTWDISSVHAFLTGLWDTCGYVRKVERREPVAGIRIAGTYRTQEHLKHLFLRVGIPLTVSLSDIPETYPDDPQQHYRTWDLSVPAVGFTALTEVFTFTTEEHTHLLTTRHTPTYPTCDAVMARKVYALLNDTQNVDVTVWEQFVKNVLPIGDDGRRRINLDLMTQWGIPSGNPVGEHYGWVTSSAIRWDSIVSIAEDGEHSVYDVEVPDVHNFVVNNTIVHNSTTSLMLASMAAKAAEEAGQPKKIVVVDLDTRDGQIGSFLGEYMPTSINIRVLPKSQWNGTTIQQHLIHDKRLGIDALLAPVRPSYAVDVGPEFYEEIIRILQTTHDLVILDCSVNYFDPLIGTAFKMSDEILFVTTLALTSVHGMARALKEMFREKSQGGLGVDRNKVGIVANQVVNNVGMGKEKLLRATMKVELVGQIPAEYGPVLVATNTRDMRQLFQNPLLSEGYFRLVSRCLGNWRLRAPDNIRESEHIKALIRDGYAL